MIETIKDKPYRYDECGLEVVLYGVTQYACKKCGETYVSIPKMQQLHQVIGAYICEKRKAILKAAEIQFLRKTLQLKSKEFALSLGVTPSTISRWENGKTEIGDSYDRLLRALFLNYISTQYPHRGQGDIIELFRMLPHSRKKIEQPREIKLNPQEWLGAFGEERRQG
ncbi:MAG: type II toxin-antitoxin system MqsA family antitoxin [Desulfobacteraceae bacterium]|nr:type II toxin-antitoxin system MqsA family antitoxin [Desulfobacteraceae bacterium]